jgi:hypothetical protein
VSTRSCEPSHPAARQSERCPGQDALHPHGSRRNGNHQNASHPVGTSKLIQLTILRARTIALIAVLLSGARRRSLNSERQKPRSSSGRRSAASRQKPSLPSVR